MRERNNLKARICHSNELWFKFKARLLFRLHSYCLNWHHFKVTVFHCSVSLSLCVTFLHSFLYKFLPSLIKSVCDVYLISLCLFSSKNVKTETIYFNSPSKIQTLLYLSHSHSSYLALKVIMLGKTEIISFILHSSKGTSLVVCRANICHLIS